MVQPARFALLQVSRILAFEERIRKFGIMTLKPNPSEDGKVTLDANMKGKSFLRSRDVLVYATLNEVKHMYSFTGLTRARCPKMHYKDKHASLVLEALLSTTSFCVGEFWPGMRR